MESLSEEDEDEEDLEPAAATRGAESSRPVKSPTGQENFVSASQRIDRPTSNAIRKDASPAEQAAEESLSPSTEGSHQMASTLNSAQMSVVSTNTSLGESPSSLLPNDLEFYLDYHRKHVTHHHYQFKYDNYDFIHTSLLDHASTYEPLLYAVVGFSAFHYTVQNPRAKISDFLAYYNRSVSLLRKSLQANSQHSLPMLLTILQLGTFEVREARYAGHPLLTPARNTWVIG